MNKFKSILFIFLLSISFIGCVSGNKEKSEETVQNTGSGNPNRSPSDLSKPESSKPSVKNEAYEFYDEAVKKEIESYFDKTAEELSGDDYKALSEMVYFVIEEPLKTLKDIPYLFPDIKYFNFKSDDFLSKEECDILKNLHNLKALSINAGPAEDLEFAKDLAYFEISYNEADCYTKKNNLCSFSMLGKDFVNKYIKGTPLKYMRVKDDTDIYELILTDEIDDGELYSTQERMLFISGKNGENVECDFLLDGTYERGDFASNRIYLTDVNFDGKQDVLIDNGHFGNQGLVRFTCFLNQGDAYKKCESFSEIANPSIDSQNEKVLSTWRNWAASHSWAMYAFDGKEYIMTDCLTEELILTEETDSTEEVWQYTIEKQVNDEMHKTEEFTTKDYTTEEIHEKIYGENGDWALSADKWNTLFNNGKMSDFSIYGNGYINEMILDIIGE